MALYDQEPLGGGSEMLSRCDTCDWLAQFREVWTRSTMQAAEYQHAELVHDSLRNLGTEESRQTLVKFVGTTR